MLMAHYKILSLKEKVRVLKYLETHSWADTCRQYDIPRASIMYWKKRMAAGSANGKHPLERKDKRHTIRQETEDLVKKIHKEQPHLSLAQIRKLVWPTQHIARTKIWHIITGC